MQLVVAPTAAQQIKKVNAGSCVQKGSRRDVSASNGRVSFYFFVTTEQRDQVACVQAYYLLVVLCCQGETVWRS